CQFHCQCLHFQCFNYSFMMPTNASDLLERQVVSIVELTQTSEDAAIVSNIGEAAKVPILSFSDTTSLFSNKKLLYLVRMALSDELEMKAIAAVVKHYGWRRIVFVHSDVDFGCGAVSMLSDALVNLGSEIVYISMISSSAERQSIRKELYKLRALESRVFVVHVPCDLGLNLFNEAEETGMMKAGYVWITTPRFTSVWDYVLNASTMPSMQGLLGVKTHIPNSQRLKDFTQRWERQFKHDNPNTKNTELSVYGLLAYDAVFTIARAIENMEINGSFSFLTPSSSHHPPRIKNGDSIKVFQQGEQLLQQIFLTNFAGLSGPIELHNGEIDGCKSSYEIVNVVGKSYQVVGYWPYNSSKLFKTLPISMGNEGVGPIIWPGRSTKAPRGWEIPTNGLKRLRIAVPRARWKEFVNVTFYSDRNESVVTGFCIDVFGAVVKLLDYELLYDFFPYPDDANSHTKYDNLVREVYLKKYDAAVGDITIRAGRSEIVDFTQPFTETESVIVAPVMTEEINNAWTFVTPFSPALWLTTAAFVIYTGLVVWLLEHRINPDFGGRPTAQGVTLLWFALSTVFFTHREKIESSLARVIIIVWLFVVLVLTSSYTASLTSRLTVQKIKTVMGGDYAVGYKREAFVGDFLNHDLGMTHKILRPFSSRDTYLEDLLKGRKNGGVDAIFDEIPYVRAFLSGRCDYSMVGRRYKSGGFGFVFPKGSPLVPDFSKAILNLSQSREFQEIEAKYFNDSINICSDTGEVPKTLHVGSFRGLYLITGTVSSLALIQYFYRALTNFVKDRNATEKQCSVWESFKLFAKYLYQEEVSSTNSKVESLPDNEGGSCEDLEHHELV
ncbi:hypothetical protein KI387_018797, partial [Taxus chinensis]